MSGSKFVTRALADVGAAEANGGVEVSDLETSSVWLQGTFVGTVQPEISGDGVAWHALGSGLTVPTIVALPAYARQVRFDVTAYTSGTVEGIITGRDEDLKA